jgi:hypothetical protein
MHNSGCFAVATGKQGIEALLGEHAAGLVAERVMADVPERFAPVLDELPERTFAGAISKEPLIVRFRHCSSRPRPSAAWRYRGRRVPV